MPSNYSLNLSWKAYLLKIVKIISKEKNYTEVKLSRTLSAHSNQLKQLSPFVVPQSVLKLSKYYCLPLAMWHWVIFYYFLFNWMAKLWLLSFYCFSCQRSWSYSNLIFFDKIKFYKRTKHRVYAVIENRTHQR